MIKNKYFLIIILILLLFIIPVTSANNNNTDLSELEESEVNFLVEDLDFLLFNYEKYGKPLTKLVDTDKDIIDEEDENL